MKTFKEAAMWHLLTNLHFRDRIPLIIFRTFKQLFDALLLFLILYASHLSFYEFYHFC